MKNILNLLLGIFIASSGFSQKTDKNSRTLDSVCDGKYFRKCEVPVDFRYGEKAMVDSLTKMLGGKISNFANGSADFSFIVAKDGGVYEVRRFSGSIVIEEEIVDFLKGTDGLWTIGKQNSRLICSYVKLKVELVDNTLRLTLLKSN